MSDTRLLAFSLALLFALTACGGENKTREQAGATATTPTTTATDESPASKDAAGLARRPEGEEGLRVAAQRAQIVADESDFGRVLFDANGQGKTAGATFPALLSPRL